MESKKIIKRSLLLLSFILFFTFFMMPDIFVVRAQTEIYSWDTLKNALAGTDDKIVLENDIECDNDSEDTLKISRKFTLDLNGCTIDRRLGESDPKALGVVIIIEGSGDLTLVDSSGTKKGMITGGNNDSTTNHGGGIYVASNGKFTMNGGTISGNKVNDNGGGVCVAGGGEFTMTGGTIMGNTGNEYGGGVYVEKGGKFTITGGAIMGNTAGTSGGGVYVKEIGEFTMAGGTIMGNTAFFGGGVYNEGKVTLSGNCGIKGNNGGNLYLPDPIGNPIAICDRLEKDTLIGITLPNDGMLLKPFTTGLSGRGSSDYFFSDKSGYRVGMNSDGEAILIKQRETQTLSFTDSSVALKVGDTYKNTLDGAKTKLSYKSSNENVIAVDGDGKVSALSAGTATIKATAAETEDYYSAEASYIVTVKKKDEGNDDPDPEKDPKRVPFTEPGQAYASSDDNFAPIAPGAEDGVGGNIKKLELDFSKVLSSPVAPDSLKMTVIGGSRLTAKAKLKGRDAFKTTGGVKVKVNKNTLIPTISCRGDGSASFTFDDGSEYTVTFKVQKPKAQKSEKRMTLGGGPVKKTARQLFGTDIDGGKLEIVSQKHAQASGTDGNGNTVTINPAEKDKIKLQYRYLNKKYKITITIK